jgi:hypothetical protein
VTGPGGSIADILDAPSYFFKQREASAKVFEYRALNSTMVLPTDTPTKSYWIEAAESPLRNLRSTVDLPQESDVIIIGSGYTGASTAYWLHKASYAILTLAWRDCIAEGHRYVVHRKEWLSAASPDVGST